MRLKSKLPELMKQRGISPQDLARMGFSTRTAYRLWKGGIDFKLTTIERVCNKLNAGLFEVIELVPDGIIDGAGKYPVTTK